MAARFVKYVVTSLIGTKAYDFAFLGAPGASDGITTEAGVKLAIASDNTLSLPSTSVEELLKSGVVVRKKLRFNTATAGRYKYSSIIVANSKASTFDAAAIAKTISGKVVKDVITPLKAKFD